jgi:precorrin-3B methylase
MSLKGKLTVVGTGIRAVARCTLEAQRAIEQADVVFTRIPDALGLHWVRRLNGRVVLLDDLYAREPDRAHAYVAMP